ncbi:NUDIX hydrolase [Natronomonas sp. EA1]|uniref:NUDIX hydrolase n=1 Tax=Natronomonas sp. EA1 TaxID=3421655 RepID=UPI003EBD6897
MTAVVSQKAVLFSNDEVLLVRDPDGTWEFPGGRIDRGEAPIDALHRELAEETGLDAEIGRPVHTAIRRHERKRAKFFVYYRGRVDDRSVALSEEHDAYRWVTPDEAEPLLSERHATALSEALSRTLGE